MKLGYPKILVILLFAILVGCKSDLLPAGGKVTVDGKPVTEGSITFYPVAGGRPASAFFEPDGTYVISFKKLGDGLPPGDYKVMIESKQFKHPPGADVLDRGFVRNVVPTAYNHYETTPLTQSVTADGAQVFDFDLKIKDE